MHNLLCYRTIPRWLQSLKKFMTPPPIPGLNKHYTHQQNCKCSNCTINRGILINEHSPINVPSAKSSERDDEIPTSVPPEPAFIPPPGKQESNAPIVSHNEVSSSAQDPPEWSRPRSPSPGPGAALEEAPLSLLSEHKAPVYSWHHPTLTLAQARLPDIAPMMSAPGGSVVPLLLPACSYPSLSHSLVYMNPFMSPCQSALTEKKKRNRTFIDPVTEVGSVSYLFCAFMLLNFNLEVRIDLDELGRPLG